MNQLKTLLISLLFVYGQSLLAQALTTNQIDSIVEVAMGKTPHAGLAITVIKDGKIVHSKGYGVRSIKTQKKVDEHTRFAIASNSKAFTSAALGILVDEGKLKWTDKVVDHVPEFKMYDAYVTANFTIVDLLTHRSGLGLGAGDLMFFPDGGDFTMKDILKSFQYQKPVSDFRTQYDYDNLLYVVAGEVITRITGQSWSEFVEAKIMKPLGMNESAGKVQRLATKTNIAKPHSMVDGKLTEGEDMDIGCGAAAGGIYASVHDLSKWVQMHLNAGKIGDKQLISVASQAEMWKPQTNTGFTLKGTPPYNTHFNAYGLGWQIQDVNGFIVVSHTGGLPGMLSKTLLVPELNLGIVVLTNAAPGGYSYYSLTQIIADAYLGVERQDWIGRLVNVIKERGEEEDAVTKAVWETVEKAETKHLNLDDYVGTYQDNWFGKIEITKKDGGLWIHAVRSPKLSGPMSFYKANTFAIKWEYRDMECDAFASFKLTAEGKAESFTMKGISPNIDFSFDFQDLNLRRVE